MGRIILPDRFTMKPPPGTPIEVGHPLAKGLYGYWAISEQGGSSVRDYGPQQNTGTFANNTCWASSPQGPAIQFDGTNDYVTLARCASPPSLPVTVVAYICPTLSQLFNTIQTSVSSNYYGLFQCYVSTTGQLITSYGDGTGYTVNDRRSKVSDAGVVTSGQWVQVAAVVRGPTDMSLYVNGVDVGGSYTGAGGTYAPGTAAGVIGRMYSAAFDYDPLGQTGWVALYARALTTQDVQTFLTEPFALFARPRRVLVSVGGGGIDDAVGAVTATTTVTGGLTGGMVVAAAVAATTTVTGVTSKDAYEIAGSVAAESAVAGYLPAPSLLSGYWIITGTSTAVAGTLRTNWWVTGRVDAQSSVSNDRIEYRSSVYVPGTNLMNPYPVPLLWQYEVAGTPFDVAARAWAERMSQWSEEHVIRIMRELGRIGQEKTTDWVEV